MSSTYQAIDPLSFRICFSLSSDISKGRKRSNRRRFAVPTAIRQEVEVEMEIYEADSRINAAPNSF